MTYLMRGALIEYASNFLGPIPNVVIFQFNPESLTRNIQIPSRPQGTSSREQTQAGEEPVEKITLTVHFSAADQLNDNDPVTRMFGIGPRLAALEKMVQPPWQAKGLLGEAIDAIGDALTGAAGGNPTQPIPREAYPRVLFIWGLTRVLPVVIDSLSITEQEYDPFLNPVRAQVSLGLTTIALTNLSDDKVAEGALKYSNLAKDAQATANLANTVAQAAELIPF